MLTRSFTAGRMGAPEHQQPKGPCELLQRSPGCDDWGHPRSRSSPTGGAAVRMGDRVAVRPATDLALLDARDRPVRFALSQRPLAALVPSTRSSRHLSVEGLTIWASPS